MDVFACAVNQKASMKPLLKCEKCQVQFYCCASLSEERHLLKMRRICYERIEEFENSCGWYRVCGPFLCDTSFSSSLGKSGGYYSGKDCLDQ